MKKIGFVLLVLLNSLMVFGNESISVGILNGPSSIPVARMMDKVEKIEDKDLSFEKFADPKALLPKLIKKEVDIGFLPVNVAAKVYNSSNGAVICCGISGQGNLFLVTKDNSIKRLSDLAGKKVYVAGKGATPEYLLRYLLEENDVNNVELDFSIPTAQLAASLVAGKIEYAVIPEPFVTIAQSKSKDIKAAINLQEEYKEIAENDEDYPLTVIVATKEFAENNSDYLENFLEEYEDSYKWTVKNPNKAGKLCGKLKLFDGAIAAKAIPNSNYCFVESEDSDKLVEQFLQLFLDYAPEAIGGKLPDEGFYFSADDYDSEDESEDDD